MVLFQQWILYVLQHGPSLCSLIRSWQACICFGSLGPSLPLHPKPTLQVMLSKNFSDMLHYFYCWEQQVSHFLHNFLWSSGHQLCQLYKTWLIFYSSSMDVCSASLIEIITPCQSLVHGSWLILITLSGEMTNSKYIITQLDSLVQLCTGGCLVICGYMSIV